MSTRKLSTPEFIIKATNVHSNRYDYSNVKYINNSTNVVIICSSHGEFLQRPSKHLSGQGCKKCGKVSVYNKIDHHEFICKSNKKHNNKYDYSKSVFKLMTDIITIVCPIHGDFQQSAQSHSRGYGCKQCGIIKSRRSKWDTDKFIQHCNSINGYKYDYSKTEYTSTHNKVIITCPSHGEFSQSAISHIKGHGCKFCPTLSTEIIIDRFKNIHKNYYDYSLVNYVHHSKKVKIICPKHGVFSMSVKSHLTGSGCRVCNMSKGEKFILDFFKDNNIYVETQKTFRDCKHISLLKFDFYIPGRNIIIEYDGEQHFKPIKYFGGEVKYKTILLRDEIKSNYCYSNNITLIRFNYKQSFENIESVLSKLVF